jgi:hypothetical protein
MNKYRAKILLFVVILGIYCQAEDNKPHSLKSAKKGDTVIKITESAEILPTPVYAVIDVKDGKTVILKKGLADTPFAVSVDDNTYTVKPFNTTDLSRLEVPPPPQQFPVIPKPRSKVSRWDKIKNDLGLSDSEISAMQAYTTSTYAWINGFLRKGNNISAAMKREIINWLINTGVIADIQKSDPHFDSMLLQLIESEEKNEPLERSWQKATPIISQIVDLIVSGMRKWQAPRVDVVSRGVALDKVPFLKEMHDIDGFVTDPGFMSTTYSQPFSKDSIVVIKLPKGHAGRDIAEISKFEQEAEILFPPNSMYKIDRILHRENTADQAEFQYILKKLVPNKEERINRFKIVDRIYVGEMLPL